MARATNLALGIAAAGAGAWLGVRVFREWFACDLRDKVVLITGGSRGLGLVLARELARQGARLALCARDAAELDRARTDLAGRGATVWTRPCDLTDEAQAQRLVSEARANFGRIDVLINNAGIISTGPEASMRLEDYQEAMRANFWAALYCTLAVLPEMRRRHQGRIVNITSIGGKVSVPHLLPYSVSKFALVGLSEGLRAELAREGITVTTVCPGLMRTGSPRQGTFKGNAPAEYTWFSVSDSIPVVSMNAERAARQIVRALRRGDAEVVLTLPAKWAVLFHGVFPGLTADLLGVVNRLLPADANPQGVPGKQIEAAQGPSRLAALSTRAARRNNEI